MADCLDFDLEMGLHDVTATKLPGGVMFDDTSFSKQESCGTPFSQASTAPSTPFRFHLPDPDVDSKMGFFHSKYQGESDLFDIDMKPLQSELGSWAETHVDVEASALELGSDLGNWAKKHMEIENFALPLTSDLGVWAQKHAEVEASALNLQSELGRWAEENSEAERKIVRLHSELGQWAQKVVDSERPARSIGCRPLQSDLGRWAQRIVEAQMWLQKHLPEAFVVDNHELEVATTGLAYRKSKCVDDRDMALEGPTWGAEVEGVDEGDGWLKVGELYLPMVLEGMCVLTPNPNSVAMNSDDYDEDLEDAEAVLDGAAITPEGCVVDLDGGSPIFFSCDPSLSSSHSCKVITKNAAKASVAARYAQAAADIEAKAACSIDPVGIVRGAAALSPSGADAVDASQRLKLFHQKRQRRQTTSKASQPEVLCIDPSGKTCLFLQLAKKLSAKRILQKRALVTVTEDVDPVVIASIDVNGVIQEYEE